MRQIPGRQGKSVDKLHVYIMFNRLPSERRVVLPIKVFVERNNYPRWLVKQIIKKVLDEKTNTNVATVVQ